MRHRHVLSLALVALLSACAAPVAKVPANDSAPRVLLVSIDGFRADYADRGYSPTLSALAAEGVQAQGMQPSFPSLTFPNHYTLVTGKYPDHHGLVDNAMFVPELGRFTLSKRDAVGDGRWWEQADPIWVTAERQGARTATLFWPGSEASIHGVRPSEWRLYDGDLSYDARVDQVLQWLDRPAEQRPRFMTLYFEAVDTAGHYDGPDSPETNQAIAQVDAALARLVAGMKAHGQYDNVNLIVLADHGMASTPAEQRILLDKLFDPAYANIVSTGAISGIIPAPGHERDVEKALLRTHEHMQCWRKQALPAALHYGGNDRVPPLFCMAQVGWLIERNAASALHHGKPLLGEHGFDNADPAMRALFVAHGPAFKRGVTVPVFPNVDVYPLMTHVLGIQGEPGDGRLDDVKDMLRR